MRRLLRPGFGLIGHGVITPQQISAARSRRQFCETTSTDEVPIDHPEASTDADGVELRHQLQSLTPRELVEYLDKHIIGQTDAKKAMAVALRNRWRRHRVSPEFEDEINPKNILMIGPTGVGKTEIARRIAKLVDAPFVKVEATKFTELGFH
eukprot:gene7179-6785_t